MPHPQGTAVANRPAVGGDIKALLERSHDRIAAVLPKHLTPERMVRVALAALHRTPQLQQCTPLSILNSIMQASELGLEPNTPLQHAYLIPYKGQCTFQVGYRGYIELARRSGHYDVIEGRAVFARDTLRVAYTPRVDFSHVPCLEDDAGPVTHAYAYAQLRGVSGPPAFRLVTRRQIEAARAQSRAPNSLMWTHFYEEGAVKVAFRKLLKTLPCSTELQRAVEMDQDEYDLNGGHSGVFPGRGTAGLRERLEGPPPAPAEPEFTASEGVAQPLRTEADEAVAAPEEDDDPEGWTEEPE